MSDLSPIFTLHDIVLGETGEIELLKLFGDAKRFSSGGRHRETFVCYINEEQPGVRVEFNLGFPEEGCKVMGFELSVGEPFALCATTTRDLRALASGSGVSLGMKREAFTSAVQVPFVSQDSDRLLFERFLDPAADKKLLELTVIASFKRDALVTYNVRRFGA